MLGGLKIFLERTRGQSAVMRSAVAAFGFVYIHPLADGNGRVHRFLINDILRRDGVVREPLILPVSSLITQDPAERRAYDRILDEVSQPLMRALAGLYAFAATPTPYPDGVSSNFVFRGDDVARPAWRIGSQPGQIIQRAGQRVAGPAERRCLGGHPRGDRACVSDREAILKRDGSSHVDRCHAPAGSRPAG